MKVNLSKVIRKILRLVLLTYVALCVVLTTVVILKITHYVIERTTHKVVLPNNFSLSPRLFDFKLEHIKLLDPDGKEVLAPDVYSIMWCNDIVYGNRGEFGTSAMCNKTGSGYKGSRFIYDRKNKSLQIFITSESCHDADGKFHEEIFSEERDKFFDELKKRNLPEFDEKKSIDYKDVLYRIKDIPNDLCPK